MSLLLPSLFHISASRVHIPLTAMGPQGVGASHRRCKIRMQWVVIPFGHALAPRELIRYFIKALKGSRNLFPPING